MAAVVVWIVATLLFLSIGIIALFFAWPWYGWWVKKIAQMYLKSVEDPDAYRLWMNRRPPRSFAFFLFGLWFFRVLGLILFLLGAYTLLSVLFELEFPGLWFWVLLGMSLLIVVLQSLFIRNRLKVFWDEMSMIINQIDEAENQKWEARWSEKPN